MEFTVSKAELVKALALVQGAVEKKTSIPILSNVLLSAESDRVVVTATDLELGIRCSCSAQVKKTGEGTIPARRLYDFVRLLQDGDVHIKFTENSWASLTSGRSKTRIAGMKSDAFPELPKMPAAIAEIPAGVLASMISKTVFAISREESRFTLNGALFELDREHLRMVGTDGHRMSMVEVPCDLPALSEKLRVLFSLKGMVEMAKLLGDLESTVPVQFSTDQNNLFFGFADKSLICRRLSGNFPDYERVLPKGERYSVELDRVDLRKMLERVGQFSDERSRAIRLKIGHGEVIAKSSVSETGESEESIPGNHEMPVVEIAFNGQYILDATAVISTSSFVLLFKDTNSAGEIQASGDSSYRCVVMPMRI